MFGLLVYLHGQTGYTTNNQGVREKERVFETLNFFGKGLTQIETDVQLF